MRRLALGMLSCRGLLGFDGHAGQHRVQPGGQRPVCRSDEVHEGWDEQAVALREESAVVSINQILSELEQARGSAVPVVAAATTDADGRASLAGGSELKTRKTSA